MFLMFIVFSHSVASILIYFIHNLRKKEIILPCLLKFSLYFTVETKIIKDFPKQFLENNDCVVQWVV